MYPEYRKEWSLIMKKKKEIQLAAETTDKLIALGDIHGLTNWRRVVAAHPDASHYVFLGDYCDPYGTRITDEKVVDNLIDLIDFKKQHSERVVLLLGNHDMHYLRSNLFKGSRYNLALAMILRDLFENNKKLFQPAFACNHLLFTHAGVSKSWLHEFGGEENDCIADLLNERSDDLVLFQCSVLRGGFFDHGGPFWADIKEFVTSELLPGYVQIVGHNRVSTIQVKGDSILTTGNIVFCDSLYRNNYLVVLHPSDEEPEFYEANLKEKE